MTKHNWTREMDEVIRSKYGTMAHADIVKLLGKPFTASAVRVRYSYLKVNTPKYAQVQKFYTKKDERFIITNYKKKTIKQMADKLGVSQHALDKKISKMRHELPNGMEILKPHAHAYPIGTIRNAKDSKTGNPFQMIKTESGWQRIRTRKAAQPKEKTERQLTFTDAQRDDIIKQVAIIGIKAVATQYVVTPRNLHGQIYYWRIKGLKIEVKRIYKEPKPRTRKKKIKARKVTSAVRRDKVTTPKEKVIRIGAPDLNGKVSVRLNSRTLIWVKKGTDIEALKARYKVA